MGKYNAYPKEVEEFIRKNAPGKRRKEIAEITNAAFGTKFTESSVSAYMKNHNIQSGMPRHALPGDRESKVYSPEVVEYISQNYLGCGPKEMTDRLNKMFGTKYSYSQMKGYYARNRLNSGITGYFEKGHISHNKGKKGLYFKGSEKSWFQKGHVPSDWQPVGTVKKRSDGYL